MIEASQLKYRVLVADEKKGKALDIQDFIMNLGWEENEKEIATRISFTALNKKTNKGRISSLVKLGSLIVVLASIGGKEKEVVRGHIVNWKPSFSGGDEKIQCLCYDELYNFQQSQDNVYYSGISTKSLLTKLFTKWDLKIGEYKAPDVKHGNLKYERKSLGEIVFDVLAQVKKKSGKTCCLRINQGKIDVILTGSNKTIYQFEPRNTSSLDHNRSLADIVTRVKILGRIESDTTKEEKPEDQKAEPEKPESKKEEEKKQQPRKTVEKIDIVLDGNIEKYGLKQKLITNANGDNLEDIKKEAQELLNKDGKPKEEMTITTMDVPFIRKGDLVYVKVRSLEGTYLVKSIQHEADSKSMTMELRSSKKAKVSKNQVTEEKEIEIGDVVQFMGGRHFVSSTSNEKGMYVNPGKAKILKMELGDTHPYYLVRADGKSDVNGWVDVGSFE